MRSPHSGKNGGTSTDSSRKHEECTTPDPAVVNMGQWCKIDIRKGCTREVDGPVDFGRLGLFITLNFHGVSRGGVAANT
jgi:hypothetical protein